MATDAEKSKGSKHRTALAATVLVLAGASSANAQSTPDFGREGFFGGMHFVYGYEDFDRPGRTDVDDDQGLSAHVGYRLDSYFAFDLEWEFMTGFEAEDDVEQSNVVTHSLMIDARFYPLSTRIQPFFKAGFGLVVAEDDDNLIDDGVAFGVRAGAGLEFYVTDHIVLSAGADYVVPATDLQDIRYVSIRSGLAYRF